MENFLTQCTTPSWEYFSFLSRALVSRLCCNVLWVAVSCSETCCHACLGPDFSTGMQRICSAMKLLSAEAQHELIPADLQNITKVTEPRAHHRATNPHFLPRIMCCTSEPGCRRPAAQLAKVPLRFPPGSVHPESCMQIFGCPLLHSTGCPKPPMCM